MSDIVEQTAVQGLTCLSIAQPTDKEVVLCQCNYQAACQIYIRDRTLNFSP